MERKKTSSWLWMVLIIFSIILIPYFLFGIRIELWTVNYFRNSAHNLWLPVILGIMLSSDIFVPVPSSLISTAAGYFLGLIGGTFVSFAGMSISCLIGYYFGVYYGRNMSEKMVGKKELLKLDNLSKVYGEWILILTRPIPILGEAAILFAGISRIPLSRFICLCLLSNLGISLVYALIGTYSSSLNSFLFAFFSSVILPGCAILCSRAITKTDKKRFIFKVKS